MSKKREPLHLSHSNVLYRFLPRPFSSCSGTIDIPTEFCLLVDFVPLF